MESKKEQWNGKVKRVTKLMLSRRGEPTARSYRGEQLQMAYERESMTE